MKRAGLIIAVVSALALTAAAFAPGRLGGALVAGGLIGLIAGMTVWSVGFHSATDATDEHLTFGRETLAWSDLDLHFGVQGLDALTDEQRAAARGPSSPLLIRRNRKRQGNVGMRIVGGA